jgi:hypothetical protein
MHDYLSARRVSRQDVSISQSRRRRKKNGLSKSPDFLATGNWKSVSVFVFVHCFTEGRDGWVYPLHALTLVLHMHPRDTKREYTIGKVSHERQMGQHMDKVGHHGQLIREATRSPFCTLS